MAATKRAYTRELAEWAAGLKYESIPERVISRSKLQIMSVIGSICASHCTATGEKVEAAFSRWTDKGNCTLLPSGAKIGLKDALAGNAALSMMLDFDD